MLFFETDRERGRERKIEEKSSEGACKKKTE